MTPIDIAAIKAELKERIHPDDINGYIIMQFPALLAEVERLQGEVELLANEHEANGAILSELTKILEYCEHHGHLVQAAKDLKAQRDRLGGALLMMCEVHNPNNTATVKECMDEAYRIARVALAAIEKEDDHG